MQIAKRVLEEKWGRMRYRLSGGSWVDFELKALMDLVMLKLADADTSAGPELLQFVAPGVGLTGMILATHATLNQYALVERGEEATVDGNIKEIVGQDGEILLMEQLERLTLRRQPHLFYDRWR